MSKRRLILWTLIAWPLPALIAGGLGWSGVWGSGSALVDYLIPIPVAGGLFHMPSFVLGAVAVSMLPSLEYVGASRLRALLLGVAIAGLLWLLKLNAILLAIQTDSHLSHNLWQENPVGLFLLCDALLALTFSLWAPQRPLLRLDLPTLLLVLLPCALPLAMAWPRSAAEEPFVHGASRYGAMRGDETNMVFTRLPVNSSDFRTRAETWVAPLHPSLNVNIEDAAFMFTRSLDAVRNFDESKVRATFCMYEDGTPSRWLEGPGDCFDDHVSFSERFAHAVKERPTGEHPDLRTYFGAVKACENVAPPAANPPLGTEIASTNVCRSLADMRDKLLLKFPDVPRLQDTQQ